MLPGGELVADLALHAPQQSGGAAEDDDGAPRPTPGAAGWAYRVLLYGGMATLAFGFIGVFLGPTLPLAKAQAILDATYLHPVSQGDILLAAHAFRSGLIDECHLFLIPILVGGGKSALPDDVRLELELLEERRFGNGVVFLRYRTRQGRAT